jgi:hypothetical protein
MTVRSRMLASNGSEDFRGAGLSGTGISEEVATLPFVDD